MNRYRISLIRLAVLFFLASAFAAAASAQVATANFSFGRRNHILLPITLNGEKVMAVLDSGASFSVIDDDFVAEHGLEKPDWLRSAVRKLGSKQNVKYGAAVKLGIGEFSMDLPMPAVMDLDPIKEGDVKVVAIVGAELFSSHIVDLDFDQKRLAIHEFRASKAFDPGEGWTMVKVNRRLGAGGVITLPVRIEGEHELDAVVDLGSYNGLVMRNNDMTEAWEKAGRKSLEAAPAQIIDDGQLGKSGSKFMTARRIELAGQTIEGVPVNVTPGFGWGAAVGMGVLKGLNLVFDVRRSRLWVKPNASWPPDFTKWRVNGQPLPPPG